MVKRGRYLTKFRWRPKMLHYIFCVVANVGLHNRYKYQRSSSAFFNNNNKKKCFSKNRSLFLNRQIIQDVLPFVLPMFEWILSDHLSSQTSWERCNIKAIEKLLLLLLFYIEGWIVFLQKTTIGSKKWRKQKRHNLKLPTKVIVKHENKTNQTFSHLRLTYFTSLVKNYFEKCSI